MLYKQNRTIDTLPRRAQWLRIETLKIHRTAPGTRLTSSLSCVEILTALYYGKCLRYKSNDPLWEKRDRFIASKGHGSIALYPLLADLGFFPHSELPKVCSNGALLGNIPDCNIPGIETVNGSLGHGLPVGCGIALGLRCKKSSARVFVMVGDGELYEGANWEAAMFAGHHKLNNLTLIIDNNKTSMLGRCKDIIDWVKFEDKFKAFGWKVSKVDGHDILAVQKALMYFKNNRLRQPGVLVCDTVKGKGIDILEKDPLSHIRSLNTAEANFYINKLAAKVK
jgi:transketolase